MAEQNFPTGTLMAGKRGLIMGVANKNSIAWAIARQLAAQGAELAFTGSFIDNTTREGFKSALDISAYSFVDAGRRASEIMNDGGAMVTLTYLGSPSISGY